MKYLKEVLLGVLFIIFYIICGVIFDGNHGYMLFLLQVFCFVAVFVFNRKIKTISMQNLIPINLPFFLLFVISGIINGDFSRITQYLIFVPLASLLSFIFTKVKFKLIPTLSVTFFYYISFYAFTTIFIFISNYDAEKNIIFPKIDLLNKQSKNVVLQSDKIIILDFWSTSCGICFEKFPDLEATYNKYKNNSKVEIYAVNFPLKNDHFEQSIKILDSIGYKFPQLFARSGQEIEQKLNFNTFPHLIILKNNRVRFDGMFETSKNTDIYSVESIIQKLLNE